MMYDKPFIEACLNGDASVRDIDGYVEYWHTHNTGVSLPVFLGMTEAEYEQWGKTSDATVECILHDRKELEDEEYEMD